MIDLAQPVKPRKRIAEIDMVRGLALFGVLLINMYNFGAYSIAFTEPIDVFAFDVQRIFVETKSWRLFSLLFGLGFSMQLLRAQARGAGFGWVYPRRLVVLFVIGMVHVLFYDGDILMLYAELGLVLILFRNWRPRHLLILSIVLLATVPVEHAVTRIIGPSETQTSSVPSVEEARQGLETRRQSHPYAVGSITDVMAFHARKGIPYNPFKDWSDLAFFAMFLLGLYIGRRRIFEDLDEHKGLVRKTLWWGLGLGLLGMAIERGLNVATGYDVYRRHNAGVTATFAGEVAFAFGSTALALGYAAAVVALARSSRFGRLVHPLAAVGRLALTVYLMQTVMFGALFYGFAFGQAFILGPAAVTAYAVVFFAVQIVACNWWVRHFRFGPMEWVWRSLTYMEWQPLQLKK